MFLQRCGACSRVTVCVCDDVKVNLGTGGGKKKANKAEFHFLRGEGVRDGEEKRKIKKEGRY